MSTEGFDPSASGSQSGTEPDPLIGQVLDNRYEIVDMLGEGGMGTVYAAEHVHIEKRVAIKLLRPEILTNDEAVKRFRQEARSASSIGHENIIGIEDFGKIADGRIYLAMELLDGAPLNDMITEPIAPDRLLNILIQTGHGLAAAHAKGIIHRDMKPENVFVTHGDVPKLLDFGIAKVSGADGNNHLTRTGTIFGTPFYMAPEQALGQEVDHRADVYAMGVIMYEVFCGAVPFQGESFMGILTQHITAEPTPPSVAAREHGRELAPEIESIIMRAMKKEPGERYQTMDELVAALVAAYRGLAGAGMSTYMEAHRAPPRSATIAAYNPPPPSAVMPAVTPPPSSMHTPTPMPVNPASDYSQPYGAPQHGGYGHHQAPSEAFEVPRRSKTGLVVAILAVLLVVGGGAAFFLLQPTGEDAEAAKVDDEATGDDEAVADRGDGTEPDRAGADPVDDGAGDDATGAAAGDDATGDDATGEDATGAAAGDDATGDDATGDDATGDDATGDDATGDDATGDDATGDDATGDDATGDHTVEPAVEIARVLVNSRPQGAAVFVGGVELAERTPTLVEVPKGTKLEVVLKKSRYRDQTLTLDGSKSKISARLDRERRPSHVDDTGGDKGGDKGGDTSSDKGGDEVVDKGGDKGGNKAGDSTKPNPPCKKNDKRPECMANLLE